MSYDMTLTRFEFGVLKATLISSVNNKELKKEIGTFGIELLMDIQLKMDKLDSKV